LADLLEADTIEQKNQAIGQMDGRISSIYYGWRKELVSCLAHLEALVDFAEDEDDVGEKHIHAQGIHHFRQPLGYYLSIWICSLWAHRGSSKQHEGNSTGPKSRGAGEVWAEVSHISSISILCR
jgi:tRNA U34 5-carboxymethylaminomethyl modifying GTPase MnmE/TrmE